jgi:hypothetical protein
MGTLGNALVWLGLTVGLPGLLYAMTLVQDCEDPYAPPHDPEKCALCRIHRGTKVSPRPIKDDNMILVSPGHPLADALAAGDDRRSP